MKIMLRTLLAAALTLGVGSAQAASLFFDFTAAEGFVDGGLNTQNGILAQAPYTVDSTGTGTVSAITNGFVRFLAAPNMIDLSAIPVGGSATLDLIGFQDQRDGGNNPLGAFGLSFVDDGSPLGNSGVNLGVQLRSQGTDVFIDDIGFGDSGGSVDTGFGLGESFDVTVTLNRTGADAFTATTTAGAAVDVATTSVSGVTDFLVALAYQTQGPPTGGTVTIDAIGYNVIPEPTTAVLGLIGLGLASLRRR